jgi:hypothetical protein
MEPMNIKDAVKYTISETAKDWAMQKNTEWDQRQARFTARMAEIENPQTSKIRKLQLKTAEFLEDMGPILIPAMVVFGLIGRAIWRVYFQ